VCNLAAKAASKEVNPALFADPVEGELHSAWNAVQGDIASLIEQGNAAEAISKLAGLKAPINAYFDNVMVMAEDEPVRANRLATLAAIAGSVTQVADFSKLVW
jgi:glycyl-tRNA synthetase beta chain